jgi:hypothetical protein
MEVGAASRDAFRATRKRRSGGSTGKASAVPAISAATQGMRLREGMCRAPSRRVRSAPAAGLFRRVAVGFGSGSRWLRSFVRIAWRPPRGRWRSDPKRRRPSGRCRGGCSRRRPRHASGAEAAVAGERNGGGSSRAWGYGRSLAVIDRCSAAPVSVKVPMPPERPTCPVAIARGLDRLRRRRVRSGRIASRWVPASAPDASFFITTSGMQTTRFWGNPLLQPKFW